MERPLIGSAKSGCGGSVKPVSGEDALCVVQPVRPPGNYDSIIEPLAKFRGADACHAFRPPRFQSLFGKASVRHCDRFADGRSRWVFDKMTVLRIVAIPGISEGADQSPKQHGEARQCLKGPYQNPAWIRFSKNPGQRRQSNLNFLSVYTPSGTDFSTIFLLYVSATVQRAFSPVPPSHGPRPPGFREQQS